MQAVIQLQERTVNTTTRFVNAVDSVQMYQTSTSGFGPAGRAAEGLYSRQSGVVGSRCRLCSDARMYQTIPSGLMAGSASEAPEEVVQLANAGASLGAQTLRENRL